MKGIFSSRKRLWVQRACAVVISPVVAFGLIELGLRLGGYGHDTHYFSRVGIQGTNYFASNERFSDWVFPPGMARSPLAVRMPVVKPRNAYRIFLFGESAANGDPDPSYGMGRYLQVLLSERFPGTDFEVICVAITAVDSNVILPIARECALHEGDLWILYMGNNEMVGPFGAETSYGLRAPGLGVIRAIVALKRTRTGQLLGSAWRHLGRRSSAPRTWGGMQMFLNSQLPFDAPARQRAYSHFRSNLEDILRSAERAGVPVVLSTVAVNLKDCAPFSSLHGVGLDKTIETEWNAAYQQGIELQGSGHYLEAVNRYEQAARLDGRYADLQFRLASCEVALTNDAKARQEFELARDYDALQFRADARINGMIREAAALHAGRAVFLQDTAGLLAAQSPAGIPGSNYFFEHVHLNPAGNYAVALGFAGTIRNALPAAITARDRGNWVSAAVCDRRLALTVWDRQRLWQPIFNRINFAPFTLQSNHKAFFKMCTDQLDADKARMAGQTPEQARQMYEDALAAAPEDWMLRANFQQFLESAGDISGALAQARRLCELLPEKAALWYSAGKLMVRAGKRDEAEPCLARAIALRGDLAEALDAMGELLANRQKPGEALRCFQRAIRANPSYAETYFDLGMLEQDQGNGDAAMRSFERAADLEPNGPADYFRRAGHAVAVGRADEALTCLRSVVAARPDFWQARETLGMELAARGRFQEAQFEFLQEIRYRPDRSEAHLQLGLALAAGGKSAEALAEFEAALRLDASKDSARQQIEALQRAAKARTSSPESPIREAIRP